VSYASEVCRSRKFGFKVADMEHPVFVALMEDEGGKRFVNLHHIVVLEAKDKGISLGLSDGSRVSVTGRGAVELFKFIAERSIAPDGTPLAGLLNENESDSVQ
jgi:hypothetical protein